MHNYRQAAAAQGNKYENQAPNKHLPINSMLFNNGDKWLHHFTYSLYRPTNISLQVGGSQLSLTEFLSTLIP